MLLSVIIPTFNRRELCERAIRSCSTLADAGCPCELVVVDDGSSDGTAERLAELLPTLAMKSQLLVHSENRGLAAARTTGARAAVGEWLLLLDSDNELLEAALPKYVAELSEMPASVGVVWRGMRFPDGALTVGPFRGRPSKADLLTQRYGGEYQPAIRRSLAMDYPWPTFCRRHACEPYFWTQLALVSHFDLSPDAIGRYETAGSDRFCAETLTPLQCADLATCYRALLKSFGVEMLQYAPKRAALLGLKAMVYDVAAMANEGPFVDATSAKLGSGVLRLLNRSRQRTN